MGEGEKKRVGGKAVDGNLGRPARRVIRLENSVKFSAPAGRECRGIRDSRDSHDRCFSISNFRPFCLSPAVIFASVRSETTPNRNSGNCFTQGEDSLRELSKVKGCYV